MVQNVFLNTIRTLVACLHSILMPTFVNFSDSMLLENIVTTSSCPSPNHVDFSEDSMTSLLSISSTSSTTASATMMGSGSDGEQIKTFC